MPMPAKAITALYLSANGLYVRQLAIVGVCE
jgi:hypothetical protein